MIRILNNTSGKPLVVHIIDRLPPDGAERLLIDIMKNRSDTFFFVVICLVEGGELVQELLEIDVPVVILGKSGKYDFAILFKLVHWLNKNKPLVVHTHLFTADFWGRIAAFLTRVPIIVTTIHSTNTWKSVIHKVIDYLLSFISTKIIACSDEVAKVLIKKNRISSKRITVISNGIDLARFENVKSNTFNIKENVTNIVIVGRLHPAKGHLDLLLALNELKKYQLDYHVYIVGEGELKRQIEEKCNYYEITGNVTLLGQINNIPELLAVSDVFVMPSHWEGLPMAMLEAMAMQLPVLATRVGGIPDVIVDESNGLLVNKGDFENLSKKLHELIINPELRHRLGQQARNTVQELYNAKHVSLKYEGIYQNES